MKVNDFIHTEYLTRALYCDKRKRVLRQSINLAKKLQGEFHFDAILVTGWSGALVGIPVADALGLPLTIIRKSTRNAHSASKVEGYIRDGAKCLLVDDFMYTGDTFKKARRAVKGTSHGTMEVIGMLAYSSHGYSPCAYTVGGGKIDCERRGKGEVQALIRQDCVKPKRRKAATKVSRTRRR